MTPRQPNWDHISRLQVPTLALVGNMRFGVRTVFSISFPLFLPRKRGFVFQGRIFFGSSHRHSKRGRDVDLRTAFPGIRPVLGKPPPPPLRPRFLSLCTSHPPSPR